MIGLYEDNVTNNRNLDIPSGSYKDKEHQWNDR